MAVFAAVADDFTGASDQAGMLAGAGVSSLLVLDEGFAADPVEWEAVTYATRLRSMPAAAARREARRLFARALCLAPAALQYKYCSTFDSTPQGNIGPVLEAALQATGQQGTVVVPALPVNGRTTCHGYHFVNGCPLAESPLREHPLNPMTDSNLVRWLGQQTGARVGLADYDVVEQGPQALREYLQQLFGSGVALVVVDCLSQRQVRTIAQAVVDLPLISGSSALAMELPALWRRRGLLGPPHRARRRRGGRHPAATLALSGSCAAQTLRQIECASGFALIRPEVSRLLTAEVDQVADEVVAEVGRRLAADSPVLVATSAAAADRAELLTAAAAAGLSPRDLGLRIEGLLARLAALAHADLGVRNFIVAGGETAGAVCAALHLQAVEILREVAPGVPLCRSVPDREAVIALKSGNFGGDRFFEQAAAMAREA